MFVSALFELPLIDCLFDLHKLARLRQLVLEILHNLLVALVEPGTFVDAALLLNSLSDLLL